MLEEKKTKKKKEEQLGSPKGMRDILGDEYQDYQGFFEKGAEVSLYYGFSPIETPILEKESVFKRSQGEGTDLIDKEMYTLKTKGGDHLAMRPEGTAGIMRAYIEHGMQSQPQPVMLYYNGPYFRHENPQRGRLRELRQFGLEIIGTPKSVADAIIIKTIIVILEEVGLRNLVVNINSIGDAECRPKYIKELTNYYRKHINSLCVHCRQRIKTNPLRLLDCKNTKCIELKGDAPKSMSHLCVECRKHFKEVLEYLEATGIQYVINETLVRGLDYYTKTVFEIYEGIETKPVDTVEDDASVEKETAIEPLAIAAGGRYDYLAKALGSRKDIGAVGASIGVDRLIMQEGRKKISPRVVKKPKVYFVQFGFEAKLQSLTIIDVLRKAHTPVFQSLSKDSLSSQLAQAERMKIPYVIIFGQKEAMDKTVIVRDMNTRSQKTVKVDKLCDYIKELK